jgi:formate hydrogenlyase transcriptional activator
MSNQHEAPRITYSRQAGTPHPAVASPQPAASVDLEPLDRLAVALAGRLARLSPADAGAAMSVALTQIADAAGVGSCRLIEFTDQGDVVRDYGAIDAPGGESSQPRCASWLTNRLAKGETVAISELGEYPDDAIAARERARRSGVSPLLGVPTSLAGRVVGALVVEGSRASGRWGQPLIERLRLMSEILGATLQRCRHENALQASIAEVERLNVRLNADNICLKEEIKSHHDFDEIVGESDALRLALTRLGQVAPMNSSVLLLGPTGTGKELFARALHERSRRHARALVRVNCAALPPTLVESELFGHERGAFTGAVATRQGRFELADGGTIFLDEIGDLPADIQVKLLRVLQEGEFERVGSSRTRKVDVRVIAATHQDLDAAVTAGTFRADLYYRLSVFPIHLPSLAERREDIPRLVWFFIHRLQRELGRRITTVPDGVMQTLTEHAWPGNVRELENVVERAMIASNSETLQLDDTFIFKRGGRHLAALSDTLDAVQKAHIEAVLQVCGWRINGLGNAAERLGLHPNTLRFRMKKLAVVCPPGRDRRQRSTPRGGMH